MLFTGVSVALFISGLSYTVWSFMVLPRGFDNLQGPETVYMKETEIPKEILWTGSQVVAKLYRINDNDGVSITVNSQLFETDSDVMKNQSLIDLEGKYKQELKYNTNGQLSEIVFKKTS